MKRKITAIVSAIIISAFVIGCGTATPLAEAAAPETAASNVVSKEIIGIEEVKRIALTHAGVAEGDAIFEKVELDNKDDDSGEYELVFTSGDHNYDYRVDVYTGKIQTASSSLKSKVSPPANNEQADTSSNISTTKPAQVTPSKEAPPPASSVKTTTPKETVPATTKPTTTTEISATQAKKIALDHAGIAESNATFLKVEVDYDNGVKKYEVEFYSGGTEYDYDISMTGEVLSFDYDVENFQVPNKENGKPTTATPTATDIGEASAKSIALAKVTGANNNHIRIKRNTEDGRIVYEGEIIYCEMEYEFEIDAATGKILEWSVESIYG